MEKQNKFKVVIPSYNNEKWVETNIASLLQQTYTNYDVLYINDCSTDSTPLLVSNIIKSYDLNNWTLLNWESNKQRGFNVNPNENHIINFCDDEDDIILFLDGDDWLFDENVFQNLNKYYNTTNCWMTYGGMYCYPKGNLAHPQNTSYSLEVHNSKAYRKDVWRASHLRSFRWFLYNKIKREDLIWSKTGEYYYNAEDLAVSFYCMEMCPKDKIGVVNFPTYVYNEDPEIVKRGLERQNKDIEDPNGQEAEIRAKKPYKELMSKDPIVKIKPVLAGGLGNMLFKIAAAYGLSSDFNSEIVTDFSHIGTLHQKPLVYKDNLLKSLKFLSSPLNNSILLKSEPNDFTYQKEFKLNTSKNIILDGYFQSYKYFEHIKDKILDIFSPSVKDLNYINKKYKTGKGIVSIHVRRGDYTNLNDYHHNLKLEYYLNAIDYFTDKEFLVFSDDIQWCKSQFKGDHFKFVEGEKDYIDLYIMSLCEHNIIANSTFSWWGAYLNKNSNKIIIYPNKWFGPKNDEFKTIDLFPDEWICLTEDIPKLNVNVFDNDFRHLHKNNGRYSHVFSKISKNIKYLRDEKQFDGITLFTDNFIESNICNKVISKKKIGWLMESREINPGPYINFNKYKDNYDYTLTHDPELLKKYPNKTKPYIIGGCWIKENNYGLYNKSKNVSMIYSNKQMIEGHKLRHKVAEKLGSKIDLYGRGTNHPLVNKEDALVDYRYSIVIENTKQKNYITEKLIDSLVVGTIPVYWGCPNLSDYFNMEGIITFNDVEDLNYILPKLNDKLYESKISAIGENLELAKQYAITEDWIFNNILNNE